MRRWPWPAFVRFVVVLFAAWSLSLIVGHLPVPKLNGVPHLTPGTELGHPLPPGGSAWPLVWPATLATWGRLALAAGCALLPAAVLGLVAGRRPGSRLDRLVQTLVVLLSGLPATLVMVLMVCALAISRLATIGAAVQVGLTLWMLAWLARFVRDGVAQARDAGGVRPMRAVALALGRLCQHGGHLLVMAVLADLVISGPGHLGYVLRMAVGVGDTVVAAATLLWLPTMAGVLRLAGDLLVNVATPLSLPPQVTTDPAGPVYFPADSDPYATAGPAPVAKPSRLHLSVGLLLTVLALTVCVLSIADPKPSIPDTFLHPGAPGHILGTDELGRDMLAKLSAGARASLGIGLGAALIALCGGAAFGALGGFTGRWGAIVAPRAYAPALLPPLLLTAAATMVGRAGPGIMVWTFGLGSIPVLAYAVRRLIVARRNRQRMAGPWLGAGGAVLVVVAQAVMAEIAWTLFGLGLVHPTVSLGTVINDGFGAFRQGPHVLMYPILAVLAVSGMLLLGSALGDGVESEAGE